VPLTWEAEEARTLLPAQEPTVAWLGRTPPPRQRPVLEERVPWQWWPWHDADPPAMLWPALLLRCRALWIDDARDVPIAAQALALGVPVIAHSLALTWGWPRSAPWHPVCSAAQGLHTVHTTLCNPPAEHPLTPRWRRRWRRFDATLSAR
jgi:hypothetical protein